MIDMIIVSIQKQNALTLNLVVYVTKENNFSLLLPQHSKRLISGLLILKYPFYYTVASI